MKRAVKKKPARKIAPSQIVCVRLDRGMLKQLDALAKRRKVTRTALVVDGLRQLIKLRGVLDAVSSSGMFPFPRD